MTLSKTDYLIYTNCPSNALVKIYKPEIYNQSELSQFEKNIIETGNEIDVMARDLFEGGVLVASRDDLQETQNLINTKTKVIYQPVFETEKYKIACDILVFNESIGCYDLYEVKASNSSEEKKTKDELYVEDIAFQAVVLEDLNIKINKKYLIRLNKNYIRDGKLNIFSLFSIEDFTDRVNDLKEEVESKMSVAHDYLNISRDSIVGCDCIYKGKSNWCTSFKYLNPNMPEYSVHMISNIGKSKIKLESLVENSILNITDVPDDFELGDAQANQVLVAKTGKTIKDLDSIETFLSEIKYPISFIDYETYPAAVPRFDGYSPFNQIPFQFSLHVLESGDAELKHFEFLYNGSDFPDKYFAEAMQNCLPATGSIISWNKSFELGRNKDIYTRNDKYKNYFLNIETRTIDLQDVFKKQYFVHKDFKGKTSIKYILPVLAPEFSYKDLDIQEGATASDTWNKIVSGEYGDAEREEKINNLKEYCKLDTYAMYAIWKHLKEM